jgi:hypothetical protein
MTAGAPGATALVGPDDDLFHERTEHPYWAESSWFSVSVPERAIHGLVRTWYRPNLGMCCAGPGFWDARSTGPTDALFWDVHWLQHIPQGNMLSSRYPSGLEVERVVPGRQFRFTYDREGCAFDLAFGAIGEAHAIVPDHAVTEAAFTGHFEQPGRMTGALELDGHVYEVDCWAMRDRSWGPRTFDDAHQGDYLWGIASERESFHVISVNAGDHNRVQAGYLLRDGLLADMTSGRTWTENRIGGLRSDRVVIEASDALGRSLHADGRTRNGITWMLYPREVVVWGLVEWDVDGRRVWGEQQEFFPAGRARDMLRSAR